MSATPAPMNSTNVRHRPSPLQQALGLAWHRVRFAVEGTLAPRSAAETAARLFATPPRFPHTARELETLSIGTRFEVSMDRGRLAAWRFGHPARAAVVLAHGWGGRGAQLRAFVPALLEAGWQVVTFDHWGHGWSDGGESSLVHFRDGLAAVVARLEAEGVRVAGIVGHSLGAAAATAWLNDTGRGMRVVLVAPPTSLERYSGHFARRLGIREPVRRAMQERFERRLGRPWKDFELPGAVAGVRAQALVIHDAGDREVPVASGLALARAWPGARWRETHGLGHRAILRDPAVLRAAADFLGDRVVFAPPPGPGGSAFDAPAPLL